jgi:U3 small nucleolar RNA-associated protein 14
MKAKGELDVDERRQISEMLERGELLRKKIRGENGSGEDAEDDSDDADDAGDDEATVKARAFEELAGLDDNNHPRPGLDGKGMSVFDMKFMKDAMARDQERANKMVDDFVKELGDEHNEGSGSEENRDGGDTRPSSVVVKRAGGRVSYRPGAHVSCCDDHSLAPPYSAYICSCFQQDL